MEADPRDRRIQELEQEVERLRELNKQLADRLAELERASARQAAPFRRKEKDRKAPEDRRRPGRKEGHPPAFRQRPAIIDEEVELPLARCPHCGGHVSDIRRCEQFIEDLPVVRPRVTRLVTYCGTCTSCGEVRSMHPLQVSTATGAAGTHLGPRTLAAAAMLNKQLQLPMRTACRVLEQLSGLRLTPGGLAQAMHRVADKVQGEYEHLLEGLREQPSVHSDETSWWLGGKGAWLWGFTTPERTVYRVEEGRGKDVVFQTLGLKFPGVLVSDCLASYENVPYRQQKCYAHHLKAIQEAAHNKPPGERDFLNELAGMLRAALMLGRIRNDIPPPVFVEKRQFLERRANELLAADRRDPAEQRVVNRLRKRQQWLFTFLHHTEVEATNNRAERALRPAVISRKLSCGNKTQKGKRTWEILVSLGTTCHQRGQDFIEWLRPRLRLPLVAAS